MTDETIIKIETPEPEVIVSETPAIVEPVIDMAVKLGEVCTKMEVVESALAAAMAENAQTRNDILDLREQINHVRTLATPEPEPEPIVDETPEEELPVETLPEIEIIPEAVPEVIEEVKKRKRFFV